MKKVVPTETRLWWNQWCLDVRNIGTAQNNRFSVETFFQILKVLKLFSTNTCHENLP